MVAQEVRDGRPVETDGWTLVVASPVVAVFVSLVMLTATAELGTEEVKGTLAGRGSCSGVTVTRPGCWFGMIRGWRMAGEAGAVILDGAGGLKA